MADYGWVYAGCDSILTGAAGDTGSVIFKTAEQHLSGTYDFIYATASNRVGIGLAYPALPTHKLHVIGDISVTGTIYAREFETQLVSSSIIYESGSHKFGNSSDDDHEFTGSIEVLTTAPLGYHQKWNYDAGSYATLAVANGSSTTIATAESGDIILDSAADIVVDAAGGNIEFKDAGTLQLSLDMDSTANAQIIKLEVDADDLVFKQYDGNEVVRIADDRKLYFYDKGGEHISSDGSTLTIAGSAITLDSAGDIILDAAGDNIIFKDAGTAIGKFSNSSSDFVIESEVDAKDIIFKQYDGTETLRLTDAGSVEVKDNLTLKSDSAVLALGLGSDFTVTHDGTTGATLAGTPISINSTGDLTLDSTTDIVIDAAGGNVEFKDAGTLQLTLDMDTTSGVQILKLGVDTDDLVFQQYDGNEVIRVADDRKLYFYDKGGEHISSDGTDLTIASGADMNLTCAGGDINIPANIGLTFGDDGEKIEGDGTNLTIASSNNLTLDANADLVLDANGGDVTFKDGGTSAINFNMSTTAGACFINNGAGNTVVAIDDGDTRLYFRDKGGEYIVGDGTDLNIVAGRDIILTPGAPSAGGAEGAQVSISGTLMVSGTIVADSYQIVSYTEMYSTGSTNFGDDISDLHQITGTLAVSGAAGTAAPALYVQGNTKVGVGTSTPQEILHIKSATTTKPVVLIENTNEDAVSSELKFLKSTTDEAAKDDIGLISFYGNDAANSSSRMAFILGENWTVDSGAEEGALHFGVATAGANSVSTLSLVGQGTAKTSYAVFGDPWEGSTNTKVGIGIAAPTSALHIVDEHPTIILQSSTAGGDPHIRFKSGDGSQMANIRCDVTSNLLNHLAISSGAGEDHLVVDATGYVGVGLSAPPASLSVSGSMTVQFNNQSKTDGQTYAVVATDYIVNIKGSGARAVTLQAADIAGQGRIIVIKDGDGNASSANITINRASSDTIDGATSVAITSNYGSVSLVSDGGSKWIVY
jgi:hypothetical protein